VQICPPARQRPPGWRQRLLEWLAGSWPADERPPEVPEASPALDRARLDFVDALDGIAAPEAAALALRIGQARSLREFWHLRTDVFNMVARHGGGQGVATARLALLNGHFPTRSPRSGFVGFDVTGPRNER